VRAWLWLCAHHRRQADYGRAEAALKRACALAPWDEEIYLALFRLYRATGDLDRLRRAYWDCRRALKSHLGQMPSAELEQAYRAHLQGPG
jgi:DNA-binding SARP family transcriptional activator